MPATMDDYKKASAAASAKGAEAQQYASGAVSLGATVMDAVRKDRV